MQIKNLPQKIITFLKEVRLETKRVNWPTRQETFNYTLLVLGFSLAVAIYLGGLDYIFTIIRNKFMF